MTEFFNRTSEKKTRRRLRRELPKAQVLLWLRLKGNQLSGLKFRRQYSVGPYSLDFYCPAVRLAVELDGDSHWTRDAIEYDRVRQSFVESFGIQFMRFPNSEIHQNVEGVLQVIEATAKVLMAGKKLPPPAPPSKGGE
jgi:very-short-patch-repair endonuclease